MTTAGEVHAWWIDLGDQPEPGPHPTRHELAARRRRRRDRTRQVLRHAVGHALDLPPEQVTISTDERGRPAATAAGIDVGVSVSRSGRHGVAVVCLGGAVGVDVEEVDRPLDHLAIARRFFTPPERAELESLTPASARRRFFEMWTWKEAVLKAAGAGLGRPLPPSHGYGDERTAGLLTGGQHTVTAWPVPGVVVTVVAAPRFPRLRFHPAPASTRRPGGTAPHDPSRPKAGAP
jgi:phosphopantetheinyl transferase